MKLRLMFKTPDIVEHAIEEAIADALCKARETSVSVAELEETIREEVTSEVLEATKRWIKHGEYCTVEIDTAANTAEVREV